MKTAKKAPTKKLQKTSVNRKKASAANSRLPFGKFTTKKLAIVFMILFAAIGSYLVILSRAATVTLTTIEGEAMKLPVGGQIVSPKDLSGSKVAQLTRNGTATASFELSTPATAVVVHARGASCSPQAEMVVTVDDKQVLKTSLASTFQDVSIPVALAQGSHTLAISFTNDTFKPCDQNLLVDKTTITTDRDTTRPSAPVLAASGQDKEALLTWSAATDNVGIAKYQVWKDDRYLAMVTPDVVTYTATGLVNGTSYKFRIVASDAAGNYVNSNTVTVLPINQSPSGQAVPKGDVTSGGHTWKQLIAEDFTKDAPLGSWGDDGTTTTCPFPQQKDVYTGASGVVWKSYPKCYKDTYQKRPYRADQVLSVHDGVLDFWLHNVDGQPAGANPSPVLPSGSQYQTYGRYEARFRVTNNTLAEYYTAWLLWPENGNHYKCAESDYPESSLNSTTLKAFHHYGTFSNNTCTPSPKIQDVYSATVDNTQWHTYTQEWMPGRRNYYLDGVLIGSSTNAVWDKPQRWQLQTETKGYGANEGHLEVDWVAVYAY